MEYLFYLIKYKILFVFSVETDGFEGRSMFMKIYNVDCEVNRRNNDKEYFRK